MEGWIKQQKGSGLHIIALILYAGVIFGSYLNPAIVFVGFIIFFILTSLKRVWKMLLFMVAIGGVLTIFPFLAPFAFILMIVLFISRVKYVKKHWKAIRAGLIIYGSSVPLYFRSINYNGIENHSVIEPIIVAVIGGIVLHKLLSGLYIQGYSSSSALGIMGSVPIVIIGFILPFLKLHFWDSVDAPMVHDVGFHPVEGQILDHGGGFDPVPSNVIPFPNTTTISTSHDIFPNVQQHSPDILEQFTQDNSNISNGSDSFNSNNIVSSPSDGSITDSQWQSNTQPIDQPHIIASNLNQQNIIDELVQHLQNHSLHTEQNILGGQNIYSNGEMVGTTQPNLLGGEDIYDVHYVEVASTQENIFQGEDIYSHGVKIGSTEANIFNGVDIKDAHGNLIAYTMQNIHDGQDIYNAHGEKIASTQSNILGGQDSSGSNSSVEVKQNFGKYHIDADGNVVYDYNYKWD